MVPTVPSATSSGVLDVRLVGGGLALLRECIHLSKSNFLLAGCEWAMWVGWVVGGGWWVVCGVWQGSSFALNVDRVMEN